NVFLDVNDVPGTELFDQGVSHNRDERRVKVPPALALDERVHPGKRRRHDGSPEGTVSGLYYASTTGGGPPAISTAQSGQCLFFVGDLHESRVRSGFALVRDARMGVVPFGTTSLWTSARTGRFGVDS